MFIIQHMSIVERRVHLYSSHARNVTRRCRSRRRRRRHHQKLDVMSVC